eukprot:TRINITY_DN551_c0_g1_i1.p1 TRINITY_DN551_c0_g1~~TRINITY_DN551_c0_g1_i1.p1  ORF type:complete len:437 (+),score=130.25 TRINITY_DN551_c0_g1_i1:107-1417(+)
MSNNVSNTVDRVASNVGAAGRQAAAETRGFFDGLTYAFRSGTGNGFRYLFTTREGLIFTLGGTAAIVAVYALFSRRNQIADRSRSLNRQESMEGKPQPAPTTSIKQTSSKDEEDLATLVAELNSGDSKLVGKALADAAQYSSEKKFYNRFEEKEVVKTLLRLLDEQTRLHTSVNSQSSNQREDLHNLLKTLNNLASYAGRLRHVIADGAPHFISIIQQGNSPLNARILDNCFRVLMHLSVDSAMEAKIAQLGAIPAVLNVMEDPSTEVSVSLQACRLLINLEFNDENRKIIITNRGIAILTELLHKNVISWNVEKNTVEKGKLEEYVSKLIRALGLLAKYPGLSSEVYGAVMSTHLSRAIVEILEAKASEDRDAGNIVTATSAILTKGKDLGAGPEYERFLKALRDGSVARNLEKFRTDKIKTQIDLIVNAIENTH